MNYQVPGKLPSFLLRAVPPVTQQSPSVSTSSRPQHLTTNNSSTLSTGILTWILVDQWHPNHTTSLPIPMSMCVHARQWTQAHTSKYKDICVHVDVCTRIYTEGCISVRDATCLMALTRLGKSLTTLTKSRKKVRMVDSVDFTSLSGTGEVCIHDVISPYRLSGFRQSPVLGVITETRLWSSSGDSPPLPQQPPRYLLLGVVFTQGSEMMRCSHPGPMGRNEGPCLGKWGILDMNSA